LFDFWSYSFPLRRSSESSLRILGVRSHGHIGLWTRPPQSAGSRLQAAASRSKPKQAEAIRRRAVLGQDTGDALRQREAVSAEVRASRVDQLTRWCRRRIRSLFARGPRGCTCARSSSTRRRGSGVVCCPVLGLLRSLVDIIAPQPVTCSAGSSSSHLLFGSGLARSVARLSSARRERRRHAPRQHRARTRREPP